MTPQSLQAALDVLGITPGEHIDPTLVFYLRDRVQPITGNLLKGPVSKGEWQTWYSRTIVIEQHLGDDYTWRTMVIDIKAIEAVTVPPTRIESQ